ncbi:MAG: hypothetical protein ACLQM6_11990 [Acidobacteriaceae bacterium]
MNPLMRALGMMLRLVGVSSPEDTETKAKSTVGLPSWRNAVKPESPATKEQQE